MWTPLLGVASHEDNGIPFDMISQKGGIAIRKKKCDGCGSEDFVGLKKCVGASNSISICISH